MNTQLLDNIIGSIEFPKASINTQDMTDTALEALSVTAHSQCTLSEFAC